MFLTLQPKPRVQVPNNSLGATFEHTVLHTTVLLIHALITYSTVSGLGGYLAKLQRRFSRFIMPPVRQYLLFATSLRSWRVCTPRTQSVKSLFHTKSTGPQLFTLLWIFFAVCRLANAKRQRWTEHSLFIWVNNLWILQTYSRF